MFSRNCRALFMACVLTCAIPKVGLPCDCVAQSLEQEFTSAAVFFRGKVIHIKSYPNRPGSTRVRSAVTVAATEFWKGHPVPEVTLHVVETRWDCIGARFELRKEYLVFASSERAEDHGLGNTLWYGWLDVLPKGSRILTAHTTCSLTAEVKGAAGTIQTLGVGNKPTR